MATVRVHKGRKGEEPRYLVVLDAAEQHILGSLPRRLRDILLDPRRAPKVAGRLFPPAHVADPAEEAEHLQLIGKSLYEDRLAALTAFEATLTRHSDPRRPAAGLRLAPAEVRLWLHVVNDLRLLLSTELDIRDNDWSRNGPERPEDVASFELLLRLTALQQDLLDAVAS